MITGDCLDQICSEVDSYSDDRMTREFDNFFKEQPFICEFITDITGDGSVQIQELSLFLSYMILKAFKQGQKGDLAQVAPENIEAAYQESESWIERISQGGDLSELPADPEPHLIQYVISELNQPFEDGTSLDEEQKGEAFFVLKTVISSVTRSPLGKQN